MLKEWDTGTQVKTHTATNRLSLLRRRAHNDELDTTVCATIVLVRPRFVISPTVSGGVVVVVVL